MLGSLLHFKFFNFVLPWGFSHHRQENDRIWFVAPLIAKLPAAVQGKVLRAAGQVLESGSWACIASSSSSKSKDKDKQVQRR